MIQYGSPIPLCQTVLPAAAPWFISAGVIVKVVESQLFAPKVIRLLLAAVLQLYPPLSLQAMMTSAT